MSRCADWWKATRGNQTLYFDLNDGEQKFDHMEATGKQYKRDRSPVMVAAKAFGLCRCPPGLRLEQLTEQPTRLVELPGKVMDCRIYYQGFIHK